MGNVNVQCKGKQLDLGGFQWTDTNSNGKVDGKELLYQKKPADADVLVCYNELKATIAGFSKASAVSDGLPLEKIIQYGQGSMKLTEADFPSAKARETIIAAVRRYATSFEGTPELSIGKAGTAEDWITTFSLSGVKKGTKDNVEIRVVATSSMAADPAMVDEVLARALYSKTVNMDAKAFGFDNTVCKLYGKEGPQGLRSPIFIQPGMLSTEGGLQCTSVTYSGGF